MLSEPVASCFSKLARALGPTSEQSFGQELTQFVARFPGQRAPLHMQQKTRPRLTATEQETGDGNMEESARIAEEESATRGATMLRAASSVSSTRAGYSAASSSNAIAEGTPQAGVTHARQWREEFRHLRQIF